MRYKVTGVWELLTGNREKLDVPQFFDKRYIDFININKRKDFPAFSTLSGIIMRQKS